MPENQAEPKTNENEPLQREDSIIDEDPYDLVDRDKYLNDKQERDRWKEDQETLEKDFVPHFLPTFRVRSKLYSVPIILVVALAGLLAYLTYVEAGVDYIEGGYISEEEYGALAALLNAIIFTAMAAIASFVIIFLVKKFGINVLKYLFGANLAFVGYFLTLFFSEIILYLIFIRLPETQFIVDLYYSLDIVLMIASGVFMVILLYLYFKTGSYATKNFFVFYIALLIGAMMGIIMPLWTSIAILIGFSLWDIFAVKSKRGPIKEMIDIFSSSDPENQLTEEEIQQRIANGEAVYDTKHLEIGIGDLAFYSMLTSAALLQTNNLFVMILTAIAVVIGTGITIAGLKRNKILPGLPISIFLGIATMLISWAFFLLI